MEIRGNGSIEQMEKGKLRSRCRKWRLWVYTDNGKRSKVINGTYTQAEKALKSLIEDLKAISAQDDKFSSFAETWLTYRELCGELEFGTLENDRHSLAVINRHVGDMQVSKITPTIAKKAIASMRAGHSGTYTQKLYITMKAVLQEAVNNDVIRKNPLSAVKPPRNDTKEKESMTEAELEEFISNVREMPMDGRTMALRYIAGLGLRRGEAVAIAVSSLDLENHMVTIERSLKERQGVIGGTKTAAGNRKLPMPNWLVADTLAWLELRKALGFSDAETLCCSTQGGVLLTQNFYRWYMIHRKELGAEKYTLHQLRHSNLSMMARKANVFDLQNYAGWSSIEPAKIYVHANMESLRSAVSDAFNHIPVTCTKTGQEL